MNIVPAILATCALASGITAPGGSRVQGAPPPRSAAELAARYKDAHAKKDTGAIEQLFYWGSSTERTRTAVKSFIQHDVANRISGVTVKPLGPHELTQYTQDGVAYRITLQPTAKLVIEFLPRTEARGTYKSEETSYFIGVRNGEYWLVTAEPVPPSAPPH